MQLGFYVSGTSGASADQQLAVLANDIANAGTTGYRADRTSFAAMMSKKVTEGPGGLPAAFGGQGRQYIDMSEGGLRLTNNPLDIALRGNAYLKVKMKDGTVAYTRDGNLIRSATGKLLTSAGLTVLSPSGSSITVPPGQVKITSGGVISIKTKPQAAFKPVGTLGLAAFSDMSKVKKHGGTLLITPTSNVTAANPKTTSVVQGSLELSNVNPILTMTQMMRVLRSYQSQLKVLQQYGSQMKELSQQVASVNG